LQRQVVPGIEDELIAAVNPLMAGDDLRPGDDHHLVDEALHNHVLEGEAGWVLSYRIECGTPPKKAKAETCPSRKASVVSAG
jgi:hypothetical protein